MIPIEAEPYTLGGALFAERCHFCKTPTRMWHISSNTPVCTACAEVHDVSELIRKGEEV